MVNPDRRPLRRKLRISTDPSLKKRYLSIWDDVIKGWLVWISIGFFFSISLVRISFKTIWPKTWFRYKNPTEKWKLEGLNPGTSGKFDLRTRQPIKNETPPEILYKHIIFNSKLKKTNSEVKWYIFKLNKLSKIKFYGRL